MFSGPNMGVGLDNTQRLENAIAAITINIQKLKAVRDNPDIPEYQKGNIITALESSRKARDDFRKKLAAIPIAKQQKQKLKYQELLLYNEVERLKALMLTPTRFMAANPVAMNSARVLLDKKQSELNSLRQQINGIDGTVSIIVPDMPSLNFPVSVSNQTDLIAANERIDRLIVKRDEARNDLVIAQETMARRDEHIQRLKAEREQRELLISELELKNVTKRTKLDVLRIENEEQKVKLLQREEHVQKLKIKRDEAVANAAAYKLRITEKDALLAIGVLNKEKSDVLIYELRSQAANAGMVPTSVAPLTDVTSGTASIFQSDDISQAQIFGVSPMILLAGAAVGLFIMNQSKKRRN